MRLRTKKNGIVLDFEKNQLRGNGQADFDSTTCVIPVDQSVKAHV